MKLRRYVPALLAMVWIGACVHVQTASIQHSQTIEPAAPVPTPTASGAAFSSAAEDPKDGPCIKTSRGCIALNPDVDESTIDVTICVAGYTRTVRPAGTFTNGVKKKLMREAGIDMAWIGDFELDHLVPLALGGHPRKLSNLMLQPWDGERGAKVKDVLEVRLQALVCQGKLDLTDAQVCIARDWEACAAQYPRH